GILYSSVDLAEDAEVIEVALGSEQILLAERLAGSYLNLALHDVVTGVIEPRDHHVVDEELISLLDHVGDVFVAGLAGRRCGVNFQRGVGKPVIEVITEDGFTVTR